MSRLSVQIGRLIRSRLGFGYSVGNASPASASEVETCWTALGGQLPLPAELVELYRWNGLDIPLRDRNLLPLSRVPDEFALMMSTYGNSYGVPRPADERDLATCFPFAEGPGGWYTVAVMGDARQPSLPHPVISISEGIDVYYDSIAQMLETCAAWSEIGEHDEVGVRLSREDELRIWKELNPVATRGW